MAMTPGRNELHCPNAERMLMSVRTTTDACMTDRYITEQMSKLDRSGNGR